MSKAIATPIQQQAAQDLFESMVLLAVLLLGALAEGAAVLGSSTALLEHL